MLYKLAKYVLIGPLLRLFFPCKVIGAEYIPERGGAILAGNHVSVADSFFTPLHIKRRVTYLAKSEYFTEKGIKGRLKKWFFTGMGQVPIDRSGASAAHDALMTGVRLLQARASCSASTPRAPGRPTAGCTRARPVSRGWRSRPASR